MSYTLFISRKLSLSSGGRRWSPAVSVAVAAVALSVAVMLAAVSIVGGFKREIRDKVIGFNSHLTLSAIPQGYSTDGEGTGSLVKLSPTLADILESEPYITGYSLEAAMPAVMKTPEDFKGVYFKALEGERERQFIADNLVQGKVPQFEGVQADDALQTVISADAATQLKLKAGDKVDVYFIADGIKVRRMKVAAVFNSHFEAYDNLYIYGPKSLIDEMGGIKADEGTAIHVSTDNFDRVEEYGQRLSNRLAQAYADSEIFRPYRVETAIDRGRNYFSWLSLLDTNVAVVLVLMTVVACITLISGMLIIILDKISFVGVMKAVGASNRSLRRIFIYLALKVTLTGIAIGNALMLTLLYVQDRTHFMPLDPESYYIDFVPVRFSWAEFVALNIGVFVVAWLSLLLPSHFVARISPSSSMRYE